MGFLVPTAGLSSDHSERRILHLFQTNQGTVEGSLSSAVEEDAASRCAHRQQVGLLLHLHRLRFPLLPLRSLLKNIR